MDFSVPPIFTFRRTGRASANPPAVACLTMRAVYIESFDPDDPAAVVRVDDRPEPEAPAGWVVV